MIEFSKAYDIVLNRAVPIRENEKVALNESCGRVLAVDVVADRAIPPFNRVAMDGYACRREDINSPMKVIETVPEAKDTPTAKGLKQVNPRHVLLWEVELKPGEKQTLSYTYDVYVRN